APIAIAVVPPMSIMTGQMPAGRTGHLYRAPLQAALGTPPYRWQLVRGQLPDGLRLSRAGMISGVPRHPGRRSFTVAVRDAGDPVMRAHERSTIEIRRGVAPSATVRPAPRAALRRLLAGRGR